MDEVMRAIERGVCATPRRADWCSSTAGGGFLGGVNQGSVYVRIAPHEERTLLARAGCWRDCCTADPLARLPGQLHPARRDAGDPPAAAKYPDLRIAGAQLPVVQHRRRQLRHRLRHPRARTSSSSPSYAERAARSAPTSWAASSTPTPRSSSTSPSCASRSTATRAADLGVDASDIAHGAAADGGRRPARSRASATRR